MHIEMLCCGLDWIITESKIQQTRGFYEYNSQYNYRKNEGEDFANRVDSRWGYQESVEHIDIEESMVVSTR
jgi:hypothetical protein